MVDISMCSGKGCPVKDSCYRYTATPSLHQSYIIPPYDNDKKECEYFLDNHGHFVENHSHFMDKHYHCVGKRKVRVSTH